MASKRRLDEFCRCIKKVKKTVKARPGSNKESAAIGICVKSVLQTRGRTLRKFSCGRRRGRKPFLQTQALLIGGSPTRRFTRRKSKGIHLSPIQELPETSNAESAKDFAAEVFRLKMENQQRKSVLIAQQALAAHKAIVSTTHH